MSTNIYIYAIWLHLENHGIASEVIQKPLSMTGIPSIIAFKSYLSINNPHCRDVHKIGVGGDKAYIAASYDHIVIQAWDLNDPQSLDELVNWIQFQHKLMKMASNFKRIQI